MDYTVNDLKTDLAGVLHGTTLNQITNIDGLIYRAARTLLLDVDPQETKRTLEFTTPIFETVFDYPIASDVKGNKIIDIFPQVQRLPRDIWSQAYNQAFDVAKQNIFASPNLFTMNFNTGIKTIRINAPYLNAPAIINQIEAIATNGTWATGGTATSLAVNNSNFVQGAGSLQFNVTTGAAYLENSTMSAVDLSTVVNQSYLFYWVFVPDASKLTSVELRWGSTSTAYWTSTATTNQQGNAFVDGWNLCQFKWSTATQVLSPSSSGIDYARLTLNVTGAMTGCLVNGLQSVLGSILSYEYYSKYLFRDATTGAFQETVTDDSNIINLDTDSYNLLFDLVSSLAVQQQQGANGLVFDTSFFAQQYQTALARYKSLYKSEIQKPQSSYYQMNRPGYGMHFGPRW